MAMNSSIAGYDGGNIGAGTPVSRAASVLKKYHFLRKK
jgi:hypothetical protein